VKWLEENVENLIEEFRTEMDVTPSRDNHDLLLSAVLDSERYFPPLDLVTLKDPSMSLANLNEVDVKKVEASLAKIELLELSKIPAWRTNEIRQKIIAFEELKVYLRMHLSRARKGYFVDKLTQISKIISYRTNIPGRRRRFFFGGGVE